jgi:hypothetical protein
MMRRLGVTDRRLFVLAALALAAGIGGCGDSNGDGASGDATAASEGSGAEVVAAMRDLREYYNTSDGQAFCDGLTPDGRDEVVGVRRTFKLKETNCIDIINTVSRAVLDSGEPQRVVVVHKVTVDGDKARLVMQGGLGGIRRVVPFQFVRLAGEWKLNDPISGPQRVIRMEEKPAPRG